MVKKLIFTIMMIGCFILCGCSGVSSGVEDLPDQPEAETSHNHASGMENSLPDVEAPQLDDNFADEYIDTNSFENGKNEAVNGVESTKKEYEQEENQISEAKNNVSNAQNSENQTDLDSVKEDAEKKLDDTAKEKSSEIQSEKDKMTTEAATNEK